MVSGEGGGEAPGAVVMNLMARLLHDAGNLEGAVNAYLKALEVRYSGGSTQRVSLRTWRGVVWHE